MKTSTTVAAAVLAIGAIPGSSPRAAVERLDFTVRTSDGFGIFVRRLAAGMPRPGRGPLLLVNGGRPGVLASWDVDRPAPSTAALLADAGHTVYMMDARGLGRSEFPAEMRTDDTGGPIAVRSHEVVRDIAAVVDEIHRRHPETKGWPRWVGQLAASGSATSQCYGRGRSPIL